MAFTAVGWSAATRPDRVTAEASTTREYQSGEQGTTCNNGSLLTKNQVLTPALLVDLDALEANLTRMAERVKQSGKKLRPHAKAHKCVEIAKRQIGAGATGISVATLAEAELMSKAGNLGLAVDVTGRRSVKDRPNSPDRRDGRGGSRSTGRVVR
jgi:ribosomal protein L13E